MICHHGCAEFKSFVRLPDFADCICDVYVVGLYQTNLWSLQLQHIATPTYREALKFTLICFFLWNSKCAAMTLRHHFFLISYCVHLYIVGPVNITESLGPNLFWEGKKMHGSEFHCFYQGQKQRNQKKGAGGMEIKADVRYRNYCLPSTKYIISVLYVFCYALTHSVTNNSTLK